MVRFNNFPAWSWSRNRDHNFISIQGIALFFRGTSPLQAQIDGIAKRRQQHCRVKSGDDWPVLPRHTKP